MKVDLYNGRKTGGLLAGFVFTTTSARCGLCAIKRSQFCGNFRNFSSVTLWKTN